MELICKKSLTELYKGAYRGLPAIYKYTNIVSKEEEILKALSTQELNIPKLLDVRREVESPSGNKYSTLLIEEYKGTPIWQDGEIVNGVDWQKLLVEIGETLARLHELDVYHRDTHALNITKDEHGTYNLVDFDSACYGQDVNRTPNLGQDNFGIIEMASVLGGKKSPPNWSNMLTRELVDTILRDCTT